MTDTPNLGLHTWAAQDPVDVTEINENFTQLDTECTDLAQSLSALTAEVGSGGHNCRIATGTYVGNGKYGSTEKNSLQFNFVPALVMIRAQSQNEPSPCILMRGATHGTAYGLTTHEVSAAWSAKGVSWYSTEGAYYQANQNGVTFVYLVFGYDA